MQASEGQWLWRGRGKANLLPVAISHLTVGRVGESKRSEVFTPGRGFRHVWKNLVGVNQNYDEVDEGKMKGDRVSEGRHASE